jgi:hypothetical protein
MRLPGYGMTPPRSPRAPRDSDRMQRRRPRLA